MSIWVRTFSPKPLGSLDAGIVRQGIEERLTLLTYLFCPEDEEEPADVLARLRIETAGPNQLHIYYRKEPDRFIPVSRWYADAAAGEVSEALERLDRYPDPGVARVRQLLSATIETVGFELKASDADGMGWPLAVAAAAKVAELGGGVISADYSGWMVPKGKEVEILVEA